MGPGYLNIDEFSQKDVFLFLSFYLSEAECNSQVLHMIKLPFALNFSKIHPNFCFPSGSPIVVNVNQQKEMLNRKTTNTSPFPSSNTTELHPCQRPTIEKLWLTKNVEAEVLIQWTEETINKLNKPPCNEKCNRHREKNHTAIQEANDMSDLKDQIIQLNIWNIAEISKISYHPVINFFEIQLWRT